MKDWLGGLGKRLRRFRTDSDIGDELRAHFDALTEEGIAAGLDPQEAKRRARLRLGDSQAVLERVREGELSEALASWWRDFVLGVRSIRRNPVFAVTAILTLATGIGANTIVFTLLHGLLLRSLPVQDASSLVRIGVADEATTDLARASTVPYRMVEELRSRGKSFADISVWSSRNVGVELDDGEPRMNIATFVGGNGFESLGIKAHIGRLLTAADDVRGGPAEGWPVVLSYALWQEGFGGNPAVLGRRIRIANTALTVAGVTPRNFQGLWPGSETRLYLPYQFLPVVHGRDEINPPNSLWWCSPIGRLRPGVSIDATRAELAAYEKGLMGQFFPPDVRDRLRLRNPFLWVSSARTGLPSFFGRVYSTPLYVMQGLVGIVLLLCCVNVAGLMMAKVHGRRQEFAVRTAIGAARWRLIRQSLTESFAIALAGGALGAIPAWYGTGYLLPFFRHPNEGIGMSIHPDTSVLTVTAFFAALTTLVSGIVPAWRACATDPAKLLGSRTAVGGRRGIAGRVFVPLQVALAFALVSTAALLAQSLVRLETEQTGFDLDHVTIQTAPLHVLRLPPEARMELYHRMAARLEQQPGVHAAAFTWFTPMTSFQATAGFEAAGGGAEPRRDPRMAFNQVGPGYFRTMKTAILDGREFAGHERDHSVCIVNQSAAAFLFPGRQAIGQYVRSTDPQRLARPVACRVIGLAQDAKFANLHEPPPRTLYLPVAVETGGANNLVFLINAPTKAQAVAAYRQAKAEISPAMPYSLFVTLREQMDAALGSQRVMSLMSNFFAGLALFLSGVGLYGLLSTSVAQRTGEIGVRMALGAGRGRVLRMILREALGLAAGGLAAGAALLAAGGKFLEGALYGAAVWDPVRLAAVGGVLAAVAVASGLAPALRGASVDPIRALRTEQ